MSDLRLPDVNSVTIAGRLTRDPELKFLASGAAVCQLGLAVSRKYRDKGETREDTLFINAEAWNKTAEYAGERLTKGRPVLIEGRLKMDEWDDRDTGKKRTAIKITANRIQALDWDSDGDGPSERAPKPQRQHDEGPIPEDDIPF